MPVAAPVLFVKFQRVWCEGEEGGRTQEESTMQARIEVERVAEMDSLHCSVRDVLVDVEVDGRARVERRVVEGD